ncbi:MAG TPA: serine--tRNA ligase [Candidatus Cloacimonas sp.]|jgi:seryl-tRNA synthetase|nr:serine--tRNA ligase [Candidatus Cloacimonadota bacterium]MDD4677246.1 serine--tRNA ligase [Candidatus Cloacimonadota bacterium]HNZ33396.1 serine--tRNA ligase [Candidatus Cloacimonas sp.]HQB50207.1 serine--tRNA ligase [Candidatus Cloacimonas sp.]
MLDLKFIRNNVELVRQAIINKNEKADLDALLSIDDQRRKLQFEFDNLKAHQNSVSAIIAQRKKAGEKIDNELTEMSKVAEEIKGLANQLSVTNAELEKLLLTIPNIPQADVPVGKDETANKVIKVWGEPKQFSFTPKDHLELAIQNNLLDLPRGAKISGSGFPVYTGEGARLERYLINFMLEYHCQKHNYTELMVPLAVNRKTMTGTGQLPKLEEDMYQIEKDDLFLIPTAEVPVTNIYTDEILIWKDLPKRYVAYTPCFRREAGSYGKETRGLQRLHQFNKVELVQFTEPENSAEALEEILANAEAILQAFNLHYRVVTLCTGDLSFASQKTYDLEVWAPGTGKYLEVSSVSNFGEFQARRANIRFKDKTGKVRHLHTLNGSGVATPRLLIAILETYQQEDGTIKLPSVLDPFLSLTL